MSQIGCWHMMVDAKVTLHFKKCFMLLSATYRRSIWPYIKNKNKIGSRYPWEDKHKPRTKLWIRNFLSQECIPVGCVPSAICWGGGGSASVHAGIHPLGLGLEKPPWPDPPTSPPGPGPGDPPTSQTPQPPPCVWAWRPPRRQNDSHV